MQGLYGGVVLAGGKGLRLMPLTAKTPKPLLAINGETPLLRCITALKSAGVKKAAVTTGYLSEETEKFTHEGIDLIFFKETTPKGTAGAVLEMLNLMEEDFFVLSGDVVFDFTLEEMMLFHKSKNADVTLASVRSFSPTEYGTIISKAGRVTSFSEKPSWKQLTSTKINTGIYIIKKKSIEHIDKDTKDFASDIFPRLLSEGKNLYCFETLGYWCDMGTPESYLNCNMHFSKGENVLGDYISISHNANASESVIMNGVKIEKGTKITSSIIGEGVAIGKNCHIDGAVIGADALICDNVIINKGGIVAPDSIVGKGKTINGKVTKRELFSDSGLVSFSDTDNETIDFLGKALAFLSKKENTDFDATLMIFHDGSEKGKTVSAVLSEKARNNGARCTAPLMACLPEAAFCVQKCNGFSVIVKSENDKISCLILDETGLPISREDQIKAEKCTITQQPIYPLKEIRTDLRNLYAKEKAEEIKKLYLPNTKPNISIGTENTASAVAKKILSLADIELENNSSEKTDVIYINEAGDDIHCKTQKGKIVNKVQLIRICCSYIPQKEVILPAFAPQELKEAVKSSGSDVFTYDDSKQRRKASRGLYSFSDGISIALGVICACIKENKTVEELEEKLSPFFYVEKSVIFNGNKGEAFEKLLTSLCEESEEGICHMTDSGTVRILPEYINGFKIFASAISAETASELALLAEKEINSTQAPENLPSTE